MIIEIKREDVIQRITYEDFEQRIREGEIKERTLVRFEVVTGTRFVHAGELELFHALADPQRMAFRNNLLQPGIPIVTALLVGFQIRVYLASKAPGASSWLQEHWTNWAPAVWEMGEVWRPYTYGLLHVGFPHLLFNLFFLAYTGYHLERALGRANLALLFFGSVFTGGLLSMWMAPDRPSLGASGGDFGLLAAAMILGWKHWEAIPQRARRYFGWALFPYIGVSVLSGLNSENVDNWSHLGGLIGGMTLITILDPEVLPGRAAMNRRVRIGVLVVMAMATFGLYRWGIWMVPLESHEEPGWTMEKPTYWRAGWTFTGDFGWFSPTLLATLSPATTVHPRPISADAAADSLIARISTGGEVPEVLERSSLEVDGWDARRLVMRLMLDERPTLVSALVIARGVYEHRVYLQTDADAADRFRPLADHIFAGAHVRTPEELETARTKAGTHPRSWAPATELGDALYRAGEPGHALRAYEKAHALAPERTRPLVGLLRTYADYRIPGGEEVARQALNEAGSEADVVVAATDLLTEAGEEELAIAILDAAWEELPGDFTLRAARLHRGMSVALPGQEEPEVEEEPELPADIEAATEQTLEEVEDEPLLPPARDPAPIQPDP